MNDTSKRVETLSPIKQAFVALEEMKAKLRTLMQERREPIAVIGMGCRFPGAGDPEGFWELLHNGVDAIREVPSDRWPVDEVFDPRQGTPGKMYTRWGAFLEKVGEFDPQFFGISPREATRMDPQQRLLLEVSWEALENACLDPGKLAGSRAGVFIGISNNDYSHLLQGDYTSADAYTGTGNAFSIAANRLSYFFDFQGPSIAIDTACSSSLVTIHLACQSLRLKESDLAVAGGVGLILSPELSITFSQARMMAAGGRCRTFDADAEGYVRGEGCGVIVLKRLSDALNDDDPILAVVLGSAVNQDGRSNGLTAPNGLAQVRVITEALRSAGVPPESVGYVEAHGTGTILGDPIEVQSLGTVMKGRSRENPCYLGSVKTNIGHLEAAAGVAGFIKTVLMLEKGEIPPHLHFKAPNPNIPFDQLPFVIPTTAVPWKAGAEKRVAGVSSFGFGGTNAHVVVEEWTQAAREKNPYERPRHLLCLSAKSEYALRASAGQLAAYIEKHPECSVADIAFSVNTGRAALDYRLAVHSPDAGMAVALHDAASHKDNPSVRFGKVANQGRSGTAFLFTGQGAQYPGMGKELYETNPLVHDILDQSAAVLKPVLNVPLLDVMFAADNEARIHETAYTQPALFAIEYALARLWISWGIMPDYLLGHSIGEYVAACVADVMTLDEALHLVATRGALMQALPHNGAMAAVFAREDQVSRLLELHRSEVSIAAVNGPENVVISGRKEALQAIFSRLDNEGIGYSPLTVSHAFHSSLMEPMLDEFERVAMRMNFRAPKIPIVSNVTGRPMPSGEIPGPEYWRRHVREGVRFSAGMETLAQAGCSVYLETGPHPTMIGMGKKCIENANGLWIPSLRKGQDAWQTLLDGVAQLSVHGFDLVQSGYDREYKRAKLHLPSAPFQRERYWIDALPVRTSAGAAADQPHPVEVPAEDNLSRERLLQELPERRQELLTEALRRRLAHVLRMSAEQLDIDHPVTSLGLDSIMAIELKHGIEKSLALSVPIASLIQGMSIRALAAQLLAQLASTTATGEPGEGERANLEGDHPLSYGQRAMWFQHQMAPASIFNPAYAVRIRERIDVPRLTGAFRQVVHRHPMLRTTFHLQDGIPVQRIGNADWDGFRQVDAATWTDSDLHERLREEAVRTYDLETGPLFRVCLFSLSDEHHVLMMASHHIVVDMWSQVVITNEVWSLYASGTDVSALEPVGMQYPDFVRWQHRMLEGKEGERLWEYWRNKLAGELPVLDLPTDHPRPPVQTFSGRSVMIRIDAGTTARLRELAERQGATLYMTLMAAFNLLLHRYTGQHDIIVGTATAGRSKPELANTVGYFVNPVPVRTDLSGVLTFTELLRQVKQSVAEALSHQDYPLNLLVERLHPLRDPGRTPLFQVMFVYQQAHLLNEGGLSGLSLGSEGSRASLGSTQLESVQIEEQTSPFDLTLMAARTDDGISLSLTYNAALLERETAAGMLGNFSVLLEHIGEESARPIATLPLLSEAAYATIVQKLSRGPETGPSRASVCRLVEDQAHQRPEAIALSFGNRRMTYRELDEASNRLARHLKRRIASQNTVIGLCMRRSLDMVVGVLGILKSGAAYCPLDPDYPDERLAFIMHDAGMTLLLTTADLQNIVAGKGVDILCLDAEQETIAGESAGSLDLTYFPQSLAYLIYTSGSTGTPKGVEVHHAGLANLVQAQIKEFAIDPSSRLLQFASLSFDASVSEVFTALAAGATLYLLERETLLSGPALVRHLVNNHITTATLPPSVLSVLPEGELPGLQTVISAGENCPVDVAQRWRTGRRFVNAYGPTETTVCATCYHANGAIDPMGIPVGRPIDNVRVYILDRQCHPVPFRVPGEVYIGGAGVSQGYRHRPGLTAERFLPDPFAGEAGARMYRSGDLAAFTADGNILFLGRIDHQVKVRGFRVEPEEVDVLLRTHPEIEQAVTIARQGSLVSYVVLRNGHPSNHELRDLVRHSLPDYMVPSAFVVLESMPLTPHGKIDRKALPDPERQSWRSPADNVPRNEVERTIASMWREILGVEQVGVHDNFFDLGGHSLRLVQVQLKVKEIFQRELSLVELFRYPTVASLAAFLSDGSDRPSAAAGQERAAMQRTALTRARQRAQSRTEVQ